MRRPIACLGEIAIESGVRLAALPRANQTIVTDTLARRLGGPAINTAMHLSSLGRPVRLGGLMGRWDEPMLRQLAARTRVDVSAITWTPDSSDLLFYFKTDRHYSAVYQKTAAPKSLSSNFRQAIADCDALVFAGSRHEPIRRLYQQAAKQSKAKWKVFAPNYAIYLYSPDELERLFAHVNLICLNDAEARHLSGLMKLKGVGQLHDRTGVDLIVTQGRRGAMVYAGGRPLRVLSGSDRKGDVVGAGDAFVSGWLHAALNGLDAADAARFAAEASAAFVNSDSSWPLLGDCGLPVPGG